MACLCTALKIQILTVSFLPSFKINYIKIEGDQDHQSGAAGGGDVEAEVIFDSRLKTEKLKQCEINKAYEKLPRWKPLLLREVEEIKEIKKSLKMGKRCCIGVSVPYSSSIGSVLSDVRKDGYDFLCIPLVSDEVNEKRLGDGPHSSQDYPFTWADIELPPSGIIAKMSNVASILQQTASLVRIKKAEAAILQEINYCQHLSMPAAIVDLDIGNAFNLAKVLNERLAHGSHSAVQFSSTSYWIKLKMGDDPKYSDPANRPNGMNNSNSWNVWNDFRTTCNYERRLCVALEMTPDLPPEEEIQRWLGEPVKCIIVDSNTFLTNNEGLPVLSKAHRDVLRSFFRFGTQIIINFDKSIPVNAGLYKHYIERVWNTWQSKQNTDSSTQFITGYEDYLQCPLQPLMDNLESHTYEVFEKDPVKYSLYQSAIYEAILDKIPENEKDTKTLIVMVVGAGRGPLVRAAIQASVAAERKIKVYAIEKNENAWNTLRYFQKTEWPPIVTIISADMRVWNAPEKADIMISELLGSFGDNELSPECLDGAQKFLKDDGVMIPQSYCSYLAPMMSSKLYTEARNYRDPNRHPSSCFEIPYVVHMHNKYIIAPDQLLFRFLHPNKNLATPGVEGKSNDRYGSLTFKASLDCVLHGFAGYFESILYKNVIMSIRPSTHSPGMFSWFAMYFPIREPIAIRGGDSITTHFWRCSSKSSVWYEWSVSSPQPQSIHNANGRSYLIGL